MSIRPKLRQTRQKPGSPEPSFQASRCEGSVRSSGTRIIGFAPIEPVRPVANMAIAAAKAGLILWVFMHLRQRGGLLRVFALGAVAWLAVLMAMAVTDIPTR